MSSTQGSADWFLASLLSLISSMSSDVLLMFSSSCLFRNQMKTNRPVSFPTQIDWLHSATRRIRLQRPNLIFESTYELLEDSSADWLRQMSVKIKHKKTRIPQTVTYSLNQGSWRGNETGVCFSSRQGPIIKEEYRNQRFISSPQYSGCNVSVLFFS